ncbi:hypothetical protein SUGI_0413200 [Cryptomeria japonica]|nr:hypothetical protein SUGI_0413200 [Cryptomeria japonica]
MERAIPSPNAREKNMSSKKFCSSLLGSDSSPRKENSKVDDSQPQKELPNYNMNLCNTTVSLRVGELPNYNMNLCNTTISPRGGGLSCLEETNNMALNLNVS